MGSDGQNGHTENLNHELGDILALQEVTKVIGLGSLLEFYREYWNSCATVCRQENGRNTEEQILSNTAKSFHILHEALRKVRNEVVEKKNSYSNKDS